MYVNCMQISNNRAMYRFRKDNVSVLTIVDRRRVKNNGRYPVKIEVVCRRVQKYYPTGKDVTLEEWDRMWHIKRFSDKCKSIENSFHLIRTAVEEIANRGRFSFADLDRRLGYATRTINETLQHKMEQMMSQGRINSFYRHRSALRALEAFGGRRIGFEAVTPQWLKSCEAAWLKEGKSAATIATYMKTLRSVFNEALGAGVIRECEFPFTKAGYRIPAGRPRKMALTKEQINKIKGWRGDKEIEYWRDLWMFSYLCNGINFRDMLFLRYRDIIDDEVNFVRSKTCRSLGYAKIIKVPLLHEMKAIIEKCGNGMKGNPDDYIFRHAKRRAKPLEVEMLTRNVISRCNDALKRIARDLDIPPFSTYSARHSFATIMKKGGADISFISESLGHTKISMTQNYIAGYEKEERLRYSSLLL